MRRGVKLTIIDEHDYDSLNEICRAIKNLGYSITVVENGTFVCEELQKVRNMNGDKK